MSYSLSQNLRKKSMYNKLLPGVNHLFYLDQYGFTFQNKHILVFLIWKLSNNKNLWKMDFPFLGCNGLP